MHLQVATLCTRHAVAHMGRGPKALWVRCIPFSVGHRPRMLVLSVWNVRLFFCPTTIPCGYTSSLCLPCPPRAIP